MGIVKFVMASFLFLAMAPIGRAQDPAAAARSIVTIRDGGAFVGSGICLDTPCTRVLTYGYPGHGKMSVEGAKATVAKVSPFGEMMLLALASPLPGGFQGAKFADREPVVNEGVTALSKMNVLYRSTGIVLAASLVCQKGTTCPWCHDRLRYYEEGTKDCKERRMLLSFPFSWYGNGGAVFDGDMEVVGMLDGGLPIGRGKLLVDSMGIPLGTIQAFLRDVDQAMAKALFPAGVRTLTDKEQASLRDGAAFGEVQMRLDGPPKPAPGDDGDELIGKLKGVLDADVLAMNLVLARQTVFFFGDQEPSILSHEVAIYDGMTFREIKGSRMGELKKDYPIVKGSVWPGNEWHEELLAYSKGLAKIAYKGRSSIAGTPVMVFGFEASCEYTEYRMALNVPVLGWKGSVPCSSELAVDGGFHPVKVRKELSVADPARVAKTISTLMEYSFVKVGDRQLYLPVRIRGMSQYHDSTIHQYDGRWTDYRRFVVNSEIKATED